MRAVFIFSFCILLLIPWISAEADNAEVCNGEETCSKDSKDADVTVADVDDEDEDDDDEDDPAAASQKVVMDAIQKTLNMDKFKNMKLGGGGGPQVFRMDDLIDKEGEKPAKLKEAIKKRRGQMTKEASKNDKQKNKKSKDDKAKHEKKKYSKEANEKAQEKKKNADSKKNKKPTKS